ncbi:MAG: hypothetical protein MMC33_005643 [Icmadophila ericetorum]|nr:hypothetical protein [Icmadophila ericetorum]
MDQAPVDGHHRDNMTLRAEILNRASPIAQNLLDLGAHLEALAAAIQREEDADVLYTPNDDSFVGEAWSLVNQVPPRSGVTSAMSPIITIQQRIQELESTNELLVADRDRLVQEAEREREQLRARLREAKASEHNLQEQNTKLKGNIIRSGNGDGEPLDAKVLNLFCGLRERIQQIVHHDYTMKLPNIGDRPRPLFEKYSSKPLEWRKRTIECAALLDQESEKPERVAKDIWEFMKPMLSPSTNEKMNLKSLFELCKDAYELTSLLRKSSAIYKIIKLEEGTTVSESKMVAQAFDGPPPLDMKNSRIAYTLFAALIKRPDIDLDEEYVLEKAHVICRARHGVHQAIEGVNMKLVA